MSKLHEECEKCFEVQKLDCSGVNTENELNCYLYCKKNDLDNQKE